MSEAWLELCAEDEMHRAVAMASYILSQHCSQAMYGQRRTLGVRRYGRPVAVLRAGVRCVDRNGCYPPTDSQAQARIRGHCNWAIPGMRLRTPDK